jgi:protein gp37
MGDKTGIPWCDASWNYTAGCDADPISPGCDNCYARMMAHRMGGEGQHFEGLATGSGWTGKVGCYANLLTQPIRWQKPRHIFVGSMGDLFSDGVPDYMIDQTFGVIAACELHEARNHLFMVLTKRPGRLRKYLEAPGVLERWAAAAGHIMEDGDRYLDLIPRLQWPLPNVWLGTSAEDQQRYDERAGEILMAPAVERFVSIEPMLGPISIQHKPDGRNCVVCGDTDHQLWECHHSKGATFDWVICGGESGQRARPLHGDWVRSLRDQCAWPSKPVSFMFKQWGTWGPVDWYSQATHAVRAHDGRFHKLDHEPMSVSRVKSSPSEWQGIAKLGKKVAGNLLDGETHMNRPLYFASP